MTISIMKSDHYAYLMDVHWGNVRESGGFPFDCRKVKCSEPPLSISNFSRHRSQILNRCSQQLPASLVYRPALKKRSQDLRLSHEPAGIFLQILERGRVSKRCPRSHEPQDGQQNSGPRNFLIGLLAEQLDQEITGLSWLTL
jgi:hypothetical protein